MKILHKFYIGLVSAWKMFCAKVCAHGKLQVKWLNSIRGAFKTEVIGNDNKRCSYWIWCCYWCECCSSK